MQMLAYMYTLEATKTILVSPYSFEKIREIQKDDIKSKTWKTVGYSGEISVLAVPILTSNGSAQWDIFVEKMKNVEKEMVEKLIRRLYYDNI